jgi:hypothetical protein
VVVLAVGALSAEAIAAVAPKRHTIYFYIHHQYFSIALVTQSATQIVAGQPGAGSGLFIVCPNQSASLSELLVGFPATKFKLKDGRYGFTLSYTWKHPRLNVISGAGAGTHQSLPSARVRVTATVASAALITGTVSVTASGCSLPVAQYRAAG